jgi:hypothetical protein
MDKPVITIVHELPGRVRFRLSLPLRRADRVEASVMEHVGMESVTYTPATRSVLIRHDPEAVTLEEIAIRVAMSVSLEHDASPVRILDRPERREMSDSAFYSGLLVAAAVSQRILRWNRDAAGFLDWAAALSTAGASMQHGWDEVRREGNFDPEVLSVVYLFTALIQGNVLPATIFTWVTTFGRHLVAPPSSGVELRPVEVTGDPTGAPHYELVVANDRKADDKMTLFGLIPTVLMTALTGGRPGGRGNLLHEIRRVSSLHGEVLEGLGDLRHGIPLRIR